jgi:hypothetical protein
MDNDIFDTFWKLIKLTAMTVILILIILTPAYLISILFGDEWVFGYAFLGLAAFLILPPFFMTKFDWKFFI